MGYSEILCNICGVSFNIGRIRTRSEPRSAAWEYWGGGYVDSDSLDCGKSTGCMIFNATKNRYLTEHDLSHGENTDGDEGVREGDDDGEGQGLDDDDESSAGYELEHIAGPGCTCERGYSGHRISLEEMLGCGTFQCLVRKYPDWEPEADDEPWEEDTTMFLSGLCDRMHSRDSGASADMWPRRHGDGTEAHLPENSLWDEWSTDSVSLPFHPWCLETYKRVSDARLGNVDVQGLISQWERDSDYDSFHEFPRADNISRLQQQWWDHEPGTEYVVANPLFVPGLSNILNSAVSTLPDSNSSQGALDLPLSITTSASSPDVFDSLPLELRLSILDQLFGTDIANLRLVSRAFRQLPISVFHGLVLREMPWLWEATSSPPYSPWAAESTTPGHSVSRTAASLRASQTSSLASVPVPGSLSGLNVNWFGLYCSIKQALARGELKGLRNRKRIWTDCEEIVRRIKDYREKGEIPILDLRLFVRGREEEARKKRQARGE